MLKKHSIIEYDLEGKVVRTIVYPSNADWFKKNPEKAKKLPERLKKLFKLTPEDNPVVMIVKLKI